MTTPAPLVRRDDPTIAVVGTLECLHGVALVSGASLDEAQRLELDGPATSDRAEAAHAD